MNKRTLGGLEVVFGAIATFSAFYIFSKGEKTSIWVPMIGTIGVFAISNGAAIIISEETK